MGWIGAGQSAGIPFGGYARLVGAPNCAPSLCSVAGLLLALALQSRLREPSPPSLMLRRGASHIDRASLAFLIRAHTAAREHSTGYARERAERSSARP